MTINLKIPDIRELKPRITVFGVGGGGGNAVNNMIAAGLQGVDFVVANTDAQALTMSKAERIVQMGVQVTEGLGAGSQPEVGRAAAEEVIDEIRDHLNGAHMVFVTAGMGGGTGTGAAPVVAKAAKEMGILTVGVVTKPFHFEGERRMRYAEAGIVELQKHVDTLLIIPNQNLFRVANEKTTFADAFAMADQVLYSGVACITDLMVKEGLINLDFADVRVVMREMGKAMMGTGEAVRRQARAHRRRSRDLQSADRRFLDEGRQGRADLHHRRQGPDPVRGRRGRHPHPRGSRQGRQHHRRRDLRRKPRRHHPRRRWLRPASTRSPTAARPAPAVEQRTPLRAPEKVERAAVPPSRIPGACGKRDRAGRDRGGGRRRASAVGHRRRHHPLDAAEALAVHGSETGCRPAGLRPSSGRARYAEHLHPAAGRAHSAAPAHAADRGTADAGAAPDPCKSAANSATTISRTSSARVCSSASPPG